MQKYIVPIHACTQPILKHTEIAVPQQFVSRDTGGQPKCKHNEVILPKDIEPIHACAQRMLGHNEIATCKHFVGRYAFA